MTEKNPAGQIYKSRKEHKVFKVYNDMGCE
jgi:hypothetical protein